jgi:hypothetical protein
MKFNDDVILLTFVAFSFNVLDHLTVVSSFHAAFVPSTTSYLSSISRHINHEVPNEPLNEELQTVANLPVRAFSAIYRLAGNAKWLPISLGKISPIRRPLSFLKGVGINIFRLDNHSLLLVPPDVFTLHVQAQRKREDDACNIAAARGNQRRNIPGDH